MVSDELLLPLHLSYTKNLFPHTKGFYARDQLLQPPRVELASLASLFCGFKLEGISRIFQCDGVVASVLHNNILSAGCEEEIGERCES
jgi:hypothetical protein